MTSVLAEQLARVKTTREREAADVRRRRVAKLTESPTTRPNPLADRLWSLRHASPGQILVPLYLDGRFCGQLTLSEDGVWAALAKSAESRHGDRVRALAKSLSTSPGRVLEAIADNALTSLKYRLLEDLPDSLIGTAGAEKVVAPVNWKHGRVCACHCGELILSRGGARYYARDHAKRARREADRKRSRALYKRDRRAWRRETRLYEALVSWDFPGVSSAPQRHDRTTWLTVRLTKNQRLADRVWAATTTAKQRGDKSATGVRRIIEDLM
jgi:hypothetical protein